MISPSLLATVVVVLVITCLPTVRAENCEKDVFGHERCTNGPSRVVLQIIIGVAIFVLGLLLVVISSCLKRRKARRAAASQPTMGYNPQGATLPSSYDPNAPSYPTQVAQPYPFKGYGQHGYNGVAPPTTTTMATTYAPPGPPPV